MTISHITPYYEQAAQQGEQIELVAIPEVGHFEVITPGSAAWPYILDEFRELYDE